MSGRFATTRRTRALVVRWVPYSNTSQVVTLFTRDFGLISVLAKGALRQGRKSSSFPAPFDLAGWYEVMFRDRSGELGLATEARLIEGFDHLRGSLAAHAEACFALEMMRRLFRPRDPHPEFLRGALSFLKLLGVGEGRLAMRVHFVGALLRAIGFAPEWSRCAECGREVAAAEAYTVRLPAGRVCHECRVPRDRVIPADVVSYLTREAGVEWGRVPGIRAEPALLAQAWETQLPFLLYHLEGRPRTLEHLRPIE